MFPIPMQHEHYKTGFKKAQRTLKVNLRLQVSHLQLFNFFVLIYSLVALIS